MSIKKQTDAASVSSTVTDPQTGEPTTVTGLANILNALVDMVGQGASKVIDIMGTFSSLDGLEGDNARQLGFDEQLLQDALAGKVAGIRTQDEFMPFIGVGGDGRELQFKLGSSLEDTAQWQGISVIYSGGVELVYYDHL